MPLQSSLKRNGPFLCVLALRQGKIIDCWWLARLVPVGTSPCCSAVINVTMYVNKFNATERKTQVFESQISSKDYEFFLHSSFHTTHFVAPRNITLGATCGLECEDTSHGNSTEHFSPSLRLWISPWIEDQWVTALQLSEAHAKVELWKHVVLNLRLYFSSWWTFGMHSKRNGDLTIQLHPQWVEYA